MLGPGAWKAQQQGEPTGSECAEFPYTEASLPPRERDVAFC